MKTQKRINPGAFRLNYVRASFPVLEEPKAFAAGDKEKYSIQLWVPKDPKTPTQKENYELLFGNVNRIFAENGIDIKSNPDMVWKKSPLRDGDISGRGAEGHIVLVAKNDRKPLYAYRDTSMGEIPIDKVAEVIYPGCYVNAMVSLYYARDYKCIAATLMGVQFMDDGERFAAYMANVSDFQSLTAEEVLSIREERLKYISA